MVAFCVEDSKPRMPFPEQHRADLLETLAALDVDGINQAIELKTAVSPLQAA